MEAETLKALSEFFRLMDIHLDPGLTKKRSAELRQQLALSVFDAYRKFRLQWGREEKAGRKSATTEAAGQAHGRPKTEA